MRSIRREAANIPVMTIYQLINLAARYWPVRHAILYQIASSAQRLIARYHMPPIPALKAAARQLNIPIRATTYRGHFTKSRVMAQRRKMHASKFAYYVMGLAV